MPQRIQRQRAKGWRMPEGAVYVGRPTKWGNPFQVGTPRPRPEWNPDIPAILWTPETATAAYRRWLTTTASQPLYGVDRAVILIALPELCGRDLCCWCPLDSPCHADVLLEIANA